MSLIFLDIMPDEIDDFLNRLTESDDPIERARLLSKDKKFMKQYRLDQKQQELERKIRILENHGIYSRSRELPRREYLKRLTLTEQDNLCSLLEHLWLKTARDVSVGVIAVGTTTYSEKDWEYLKRLAILPNAKYIEYEVDYSDQKAWIPKREFNMEEILSNKGEDIDIKFCPYSDYDYSKIHLIRKAIEEYTSEKGFELTECEKENIAGTDYHTEPPLGMLKQGEPVIVQRVKRLSELDSDALSIRFPKGRTIHCYFEFRPMHEKLDEERSSGYNFSLISLNNINAQELKEVIRHGRKTGIYEHPWILSYEESIENGTVKMRF